MNRVATTSGRLVVFVGSVFAAESAFFAVVPPLVPQLVRVGHLTTSEVGILVAAYPAGVLLAAIPSMALVDRRGVRVATVVGIAVLIASTLGFGWGASPLVLDASRFVQGVGGAVAWAGALAWLTSTTARERRGSVIGGAVGAALVGTVIGPPIGALASQVGRGPVFSVLAIVLALLLLAAPRVAPAAAPQRGSVQALLKLLRSRRAAIGNGLLLVIGIVGGTLWSLVPLLVVHRAGGAGVIAAILAVSYTLAALMNVYIGRISDRFGRLLPTLVGLTGAAVLLPLIPFLASLYALFIVCVAAQSMISALWTPTAAMVTDGAEGTAAGQAVGVATMNAAWAAGGASGPVLATWLADAAGFPLPFAVAAGLCAASAVVVLVAYLRSRQPQTAASMAAPAHRSGP
ncbi:MAG TPA: MFS transporter [Candidatus Micrarchaeaceae archaeon]|nr:MFS transporter [Candidatus Micrarchaeaceae archaeon]